METWGTEQTKFFYDITPSAILDAVESAGFSVTGRCVQLNSLENRVYDLEEHRFLAQLEEAEIPVVRPFQLESGSSISKVPDSGIIFTLFPKFGGRIPDEIVSGEAEQLGRLIARVHLIGEQEEFSHRIHLDVNSYGRSSLDYLFETETIPEIYEAAYEDAVEAICEMSEPWFKDAGSQRIHGDCHHGNLLNPGTGQFYLVDFDDCLSGPCVQDVWLLSPGRDEASLKLRADFLEGYRQMRSFNADHLVLIETSIGVKS